MRLHSRSFVLSARHSPEKGCSFALIIFRSPPAIPRPFEYILRDDRSINCAPTYPRADSVAEIFLSSSSRSFSRAQYGKRFNRICRAGDDDADISGHFCSSGIPG